MPLRSTLPHLAVVARLRVLDRRTRLVVIGRGPSSPLPSADRHCSSTLGICRGPSSRGPFRRRRRLPPPRTLACTDEPPPMVRRPSLPSRIYRRPTCQSLLISPFYGEFLPPRPCFVFFDSRRTFRHFGVVLRSLCRVVFACCVF